MHNLVPEYLRGYLQQLLPEREPLLMVMEKEAAEAFIPIVEPEVGQLLLFFARLTGAKRVLELGTSIGYSTICLARGLAADSKITTVELDPVVIDKAKLNFAAAGITEMVEVIQGDAAVVLEQLDGPFDLIFLDAAKGHYRDYVERCLPLLRTGGILIADDTLVRGLVTGEFWVKRRNRTIVKRMREYLNYITTHPQLETLVLPVGEGVTVSFKKEAEEA